MNKTDFETLRAGHLISTPLSTHRINRIQGPMIYIEDGSHVLYTDVLRGPHTMNPNARAWVYDLRHGNHKQTQGALHRKAEDAYCCLGRVACLAKEAGVPVTIGKDKEEEDLITYDGKTLLLSEQIMEWVGLGTCNGNGAGESNSLAGMNDKGKTFAELADIIEERWHVIGVTNAPTP